MTSLDPVSSVVNGRYQLQHWMRRTALSDDYEAHDLLLDRTVVFKALLPDLVANRSFIERFRTQAQATANLTHPALASVLDWGRDPNPIEGHSGPTYYLVGERRTGRSLTDLLSTNGAMPIERAVHVLVGVTSALVYAHRSGVVHGGLTPDDITVSSTGVVKVHDIGLTGALGDDWRAADDQPGQALWRAPEQFRGEAIGPQTDVYQIGLIAYYLVTGRPPFAGSSVAEVERLHVTQIPAAPSKVNAAVPRAFEKIIGKAMTKNAVERYASMADLRAALVRFRESGAMSAGSASMGATAGGSTTGSTASGAGTGLGAGASMATGAAPSLAGASLIALSGGGPDPTSGGLRGYDATMLASTTPRSLGRRTNRGSDPAAKGDTDADATALAPRQAGARRAKRGAPEHPTEALGPPDRDFQELHAPTRNRTAVYAAILAVLLAVLAGLVFLLYRQLGLGDTAKADIAVPSVVGRASAEAESAISAAGLIAETRTEPNSNVAADTVFDQSPSAGSKVASESKVIIKVSSGVAVPTVPNVVGDTVDTARSKLAAAGFPVAIREKPDDSQPAGTVISQDPQAEATTAEGSTVTITVATGTGTVEIADVAGKTPDEARLALTKAGFRIAVQNEASATVDKGVVTRTDPTAGKKVARGASVIIFVSGGNSVAVPSVLGQDQATAVATLSGLGFKVDVTARAVVDPADQGKVVSQTPVGGTPSDPAASVVIRVGQFDASATTTKKPRPTTTEASSGQVGASTPASTVAPVTVPATTPLPTTPATAAPTAAPTSPPIAVVTTAPVTATPPEATTTPPA